MKHALPKKFSYLYSAGVLVFMVSFLAFSSASAAIVVPPFPRVTKQFSFAVDLAASNLVWNTSNPNTYTASVAVRNSGTAPAGVVRVSFTLAGSKGAITVTTPLDDEGMEINEQKQYGVSFQAARVKAIGNLQKLTATAVSVEPTESALTNNAVTLTLSAPAPLPPAKAAAMAKAFQNLVDQVAKSAATEQFKASDTIAKPTTPVATEVVVKPLQPPSAPQPPNKPTLSEPANGGNITTVTPVLRWGDNGPGKNYFRWYILNPDSNQKVWERGWTSGETADGSVCANALNQWICQYATVPAGKLQFDQRYIWTVEANDGKLGSGYATSSEFNVKYEYVPISFKAAPSTESAATTPECPAGRYWCNGQCVTDC